MNNSGLPPIDKSTVNYLPPTRHGELATIARGTHTLGVDMGAFSSLEHALRGIGDALHLPDWYGGNLDALFDCLSDPEWFEGKPVTLFIQGTESLRRKEPNSLADLIEVFVGITEAREAAHLPSLSVIIAPPAPGVPTFSQR